MQRTSSGCSSATKARQVPQEKALPVSVPPVGPALGRVCRPLFTRCCALRVEPLDAATLAFVEPRFGHDFGKVRVHSDTRASESAKAVNALAYTVGNALVFDRVILQAWN